MTGEFERCNFLVADSLTLSLTVGHLQRLPATNPRWQSTGWKLAPQVGLEPTTRALTVRCSTIELLRNRKWVPLYRHYTVFRQLLPHLSRIHKRNCPHAHRERAFDVGAQIIDEQRAPRFEAALAQGQLVDRAVGLE